ncbi:hypothetical protein AX16_007074 [Volvariella volvacea WC 439]|nr:hypothetical protein AX16_007074 [Volvariella volvacea WC 439]
MDELFNDLPTSFSNFVELAATVIPKRSKALRQQLRGACGFLPMPMSLGWEMDPLQEEVPADLLVPGLMLTDIASGATRRVEALWMHILYRSMLEEHPMRTTLIHLHEVGFTWRFGLTHTAVLACIVLQFLMALVAAGIGQKRESLLIFFGIFLRILEGQYALAYPRVRPPRYVDKQRPCALHTGMTTTHIVIMRHDPVHSHRQASGSRIYINLEDCAVPLARIPRGSLALLEKSITALIRVCWWAYRFLILFTSSNGLMLPITLLVGFLVTESIATWIDCSPRCRSSGPINKESSILDMLAAACQEVGAVSVGFVESILPDPTGEHVDYHWIKGVIAKGALETGVHPNHQIKNKVFSAAMQRLPLRDRSRSSDSVFPD